MKQSDETREGGRCIHLNEKINAIIVSEATPAASVQKRITVFFLLCLNETGK